MKIVLSFNRDAVVPWLILGAVPIRQWMQLSGSQRSQQNEIPRIHLRDDSVINKVRGAVILWVTAALVY